MKVRIDLGLEPALTEEDVRSARQALDDPAQRIRHQWFWFLAEPPLVAPSIDFADLEAITQAVGVLDSAASGTGLDADLAGHDAAVVRLEALLANPAAPIDLARLFADWQAAVRSDALWNLVAERADDGQDPRVRAEIERFRAKADEELFERINSAMASSILTDAQLASYLASIKSSGFSDSRVRLVAERLFGPMLDELEGILRRFDEQVAVIQSIPPGVLGSTPRHPEIVTLRRIVDTELLPTFERIRSVFQSVSFGNYADIVSDRVAATAMLVLMVLQEPWEALALMDRAQAIAESPEEREALRPHRESILEQLHNVCAMQAVEARDFALALAHIEFYLATGSVSEERDWRELYATIAKTTGTSPRSIAEAKIYIQRRLANPGQPVQRTLPTARPESSGTYGVRPTLPPPTTKRRVWPWIVGIAAAVLGLAVIVGGNDDPPAGASRPVSTTVAPASSGRAATRTPTPRREPTARAAARATSTPSCRQLIAQYNDELDELGPQITRVQATMAAIEATVAPHATEIAWIEANYPSMVLPPDLYDRYGYVVDQYNAGVARWERANVDEDRMVNTYNDYVDRHNALLDEC